MVSATRKRILIIFCVAGIVLILFRVLLFNGNLLTEPQESYRRQPGSPVLVMVFYEALCPDSKHFIIRQLLTAYKEAAALMDVQLVPYGKATTHKNADGSYRFDCQHGQVECEANTYHACAVEAIEDAQARLNMIACMIRDNTMPKSAMYKCAKENNIETTDLIQKCYDSLHGGELLKLNGDATHSLRPPVKFIPTITLDGSQGRQASILKNLLAEICNIAGDTDKAKEICKKHQH